MPGAPGLTWARAYAPVLLPNPRGTTRALGPLPPWLRDRLHPTCGRRGIRCGRTRGRLLEVLLQGRVSLLRRRQVAGLQGLSQFTEQLSNRILWGGAGTLCMPMMMMSATLALHILLNGGKVLLRRREISRLQILGQLLKGLGNRIAALWRCRGSRLRRILLQSRKVGLRGGEISCRQILPQLLDFLL